MKKLKVLMLFVLVLTGCSNNHYLPRQAMTNPLDVVGSIPSIKQMKENGTTHITMIQVLASSNQKIEKGNGWPAEMVCQDGRRINGKQFIPMKNDGGKLETTVLLYNKWLDLPAWVIVPVPSSQLEGCRLGTFNRDAGWANSPFGYEIRDAKKKDQPEYKALPYDIEDYDKDAEYRWKFAERHLPVFPNEIYNFWKNDYYEARGDVMRPVIYEIDLASNRADEFEGKLKEYFPFKYKMPLGEERISSVNLATFSDIATSTPGFTGMDRWFKLLVFPLNPLAYASGMAPIILGSSALGNAVTAGVNDDWSGFYGRAKGLVHVNASTIDIIEWSMKRKVLEIGAENQSLREDNQKLRQELELLKFGVSAVKIQKRIN